MKDREEFIRALNDLCNKHGLYIGYDDIDEGFVLEEIPTGCGVSYDGELEPTLSRLGAKDRQCEEGGPGKCAKGRGAAEKGCSSRITSYNKVTQ